MTVKFKRKLSSKVVGIRPYDGDKELLETIPDWQNLLRDQIAELIAQHTQTQLAKERIELARRLGAVASRN